MHAVYAYFWLSCKKAMQFSLSFDQAKFVFITKFSYRYIVISGRYIEIIQSCVISPWRKIDGTDGFP